MLPYDIARCNGTLPDGPCPLRDRCLRYLHRDTGRVQAMPPYTDGHCPEFLFDLPSDSPYDSHQDHRRYAAGWTWGPLNWWIERTPLDEVQTRRRTPYENGNFSLNVPLSRYPDSIRIPRVHRTRLEDGSEELSVRDELMRQPWVTQAASSREDLEEAAMELNRHDHPDASSHQLDDAQYILGYINPRKTTRQSLAKTMCEGCRFSQPSTFGGNFMPCAVNTLGVSCILDFSHRSIR